MIRDITIGQYYPAKSVLHRLDPRTKFLGTLGFLAEVDKNSVYPALDRLLTDDDELEEPFLGYEEETDRFVVWKWFDDHHPSGVKDLLLGSSV